MLDISKMFVYLAIDKYNGPCYACDKKRFGYQRNICSKKIAFLVNFMFDSQFFFYHQKSRFQAVREKNPVRKLLFRETKIAPRTVPYILKDDLRFAAYKRCIGLSYLSTEKMYLRMRKMIIRL